MSEAPSEVLTGIRSVFSVPGVYRLAQRAVGAEKFRERLVSEVLKPHERARILDIGCGTADILEVLPSVEYVGFDHSQEYVAAAKERFGSLGEFIHATTDGVDVTGLPKFDLVMSIGVLHHLDDSSVEDVLRTAAAALKPGGRFVSVDPTFAEGQHWFGKLLASRDRGQHVRSPAELRRLVEGIFGEFDVSVRHDMLTVPYSHVLVDAR